MTNKHQMGSSSRAANANRRAWQFLPRCNNLAAPVTGRAGRHPAPVCARIALPAVMRAQPIQ